MTFLKEATRPTPMRRIAPVLLVAALLTPGVARAQSGDTVIYYHTDAIGSVRMITDASGAVIQRSDFLPFGQQWPQPLNPPDVRQFAGEERDPETKLDYFGARYFRPESGRFTTVDPVMNVESASTDPQRWNRYAYANNNPFRFIDPDGRDILPTAWNTGKGADGWLRGLPAIGKALWNAVIVGIVQNPGHPSGAEAEARREAQFLHPANNEEAVIMGLTDLAMLAAPLMRTTRTTAGLTVGEEISILREASRGRGNFGLGSASADDAARLGEAWVGRGYAVANDGKTLLSADGLRQYRPPTYKPNLNRIQANFESRPLPRGAWGSNGHLDIYK